MSNKNNVNPDHYKIAGRDRPGEDVVHERNKHSLGRDRARLARLKAGRRPRPPATTEAEGQEES